MKTILNTSTPLARRIAWNFAVLLMLLAPTAFAVTDTWVGGSGNSFSTTANWTYSSGSGPVASGDTLIFSGAGSTIPNNDLTSFAFGGISFGGTTPYTISGNAFALSSGASIVNGGAVNQTINNNITLTGTGGIINPSVASAGITLGGIISGAANFTKTGNSSSTLTLSGVNTFSGVLNLNAGTVVFTTPPSVSGGNLGNPSGITFGGSSSTTLVTTPGAGNVTIASPTITVSSSSTSVIKNGGASGTTFEISAKITGVGNCRQNSPTTGGAIVRFSNDTSDYTGTFLMAGGVVEFTSVANAGSASSLGAGSSVYTIANSASAAVFRYVGSTGTITTRAMDWSATTGTLSLENNGGGTVQFLATGNLRSGASGANTLTLQGSNTSTNALAQVINDATTPGATAVTKAGNGLWILTGANTYSGLTTVSAGTLQVAGLGTLGASSGALTVSGGTLDLSGTSQSKGTVTISGASTIRNGTLTGSSYSATLASGTAVVSANLAGSGVALSLSGAGSLALLGANTYSGGTTIGSAGTIYATNDAALGSSSAGLTFTSSGTLAATNNAATANNPVTISSSRTITVNSGVTANFQTPDTNNLIIAAKITGAGSVLKRSSSFALGTVRFSNDTSDYTGDFTAGFGNAEFTSVADQGTPSSLGAGAAGNGGQITLGNSSSSGTLRYVGSGASTTHRPLNWTATTASGYTLDASGGGSLQFLATAAMRSGSGGPTALILRGTNTSDNTLAQVINDQGGVTSLTKNDAGTWVLTAANTYSGNTTITAGTLKVSNLSGSATGSGSVTVASAGKLTGSGTISGPVSISGTVSPGSSPGMLTTGPATLNTSGTYVWEISSTNTAGVGYDLLAVNGGIDVQSTAANPFTNKLVAIGLTDFNNDLTNVFTIASTTDSVTNFAANKFSINDTGFTNDLAGGTFSMETGSLNLRFTPNHAPVASLFTVQRGAGTSLKIKIADLKAATWSDPDNDDTAMTAIDASSTNGLNNVTTNDTYIFYTPGINGNVTDRINYTIRDLRAYRAGDTVRTSGGVIEIQAVESVSTNTVTGLTSLGVGTNQISFAGIPGYEYVVQFSTNLTDWESLSTNTAGSNGQWSVIDDTATNAMRFYRSVAR